MSDKKSVLVIENDHDTRVLIRKIFEESGFSVFSVTSGVDALDTLEKITLLSVVIFSKAGYTLHGEKFLNIFISNPKYSQVPIVQLLQNDENGLFEGVSYSIKKPVMVEELKKIAEKIKITAIY